MFSLSQMAFDFNLASLLTHWGRVTHICVDNLTIIGSDNGLSPGRRQAIIWTNAGILLIGPLGTNFSEISIEIHTFPFKKMHLNMSSAKWRLFRLGLDELKQRSAKPACILDKPPLKLWHGWVLRPTDIYGMQSLICVIISDKSCE